ncbi:hypothetical protein [Novipirellula artificiosorum]|uniref:Uncharacterized protein n=1 Tax=Novipirellula artificiosorum TaxID=2528016 RepID=A0A5C6DZ52_9BACT|nr:hypothetical protein [Novipirellula artificiosorum]TWU40691.1 hypothetical protein Poly41_15260 [Novipirellula artificiosorum]
MSPATPWSRTAVRAKLSTSRFDLVSSFLLALVWFAGTLVCVLLLIWVLGRAASPVPVPPSPAAVSSVALPHDRSVDAGFEVPSDVEVAELIAPSLQESIRAVTRAVRKVAVSVDHQGGFPERLRAGVSLRVGPTLAQETVSRSDRWHLQFTANRLEDYAKQLDHFGIEVGVVGGSIQGVDVARQLSGDPVKERILDSASEKRLYFRWTTPSPLMQYDQALLLRAGIDSEDRHVLKFIPATLEETLAKTELDYAITHGRKSAHEITKTVFESVPTANGYAFIVVSQRYRRVPQSGD